MRDEANKITTTKAEMRLIIKALDAYRHNTAFRNVHQKLLAQLEPHSTFDTQERRRSNVAVRSSFPDNKGDAH